MYYSKSTGGFYSREIHGDNIPSDAVEITKDEHAALLQGQSDGKRIVADENGKPVLKDQPAPTQEQVKANEISSAKTYLSLTDWYVTRKIETGKEIPEEVVVLRQQARDLISQ